MWISDDIVYDIGSVSKIIYYAFGLTLFGYGLSSGPITWIYIADILPDVGVALVNSFMQLFIVFIAWYPP